MKRLSPAALALYALLVASLLLTQFLPSRPVSAEHSNLSSPAFNSVLPTPTTFNSPLPTPTTPPASQTPAPTSLPTPLVSPTPTPAPEGSEAFEIGPGGGSHHLAVLPMDLTLDSGTFTDTVQVQVDLLPADIQQAITPFPVAFKMQMRLRGQPNRSAPVPAHPLHLQLDYGQMPGIGNAAGRLTVYQGLGCTVHGRQGPGQALECEQLLPLEADNDRGRDRLTISITSAGQTEHSEVIVPGNDPAGTRSTSTTAGSDSSAADTPIPAGNARAAGGGSETIYVLTAGGSGLEGDYRASPLPALQDFQVGLFTGSAQTSYAIPLPPAWAGNTPELALSYDSGAVDVMTSNKNTRRVGSGLAGRSSRATSPAFSKPALTTSRARLRISVLPTQVAASRILISLCSTGVPRG